jgi:hypothetical protein
VDLGLPGASNGWLTAARLSQTDGGPALRVEAACVGDAAQSRMLHVSGLTGVEELSTPVTLAPGRPTTIDLPLPATFAREGSRARLWLAPADELAVDDELHLNLDAAGAVRLLLIDPETPADDTLRAGYALRTALDVLAEAGGLASDVERTVRAPAAVSAQDLEEADVVLLADVPGLSDSQAETLTGRVHSGAGLGVFLGPNVQLDNYNTRLTDPLHPGQALLPGRLSGVVQAPAVQGGLAAWGRWDERHQLLAGLLDPVVGDLAGAQSQAYARFSDPPPVEEVLAAFDDGTPALVARQVGAGRVVLFNASADDRWCDLPRRKGFVPLIDRLLAHLAPLGRGRTFAAGEPVTLLLLTAPEAPPNVRSPSGELLSPRWEATNAGTLLRLEAPSEPGFYTVGTGDEPPEGQAGAASISFVVQASREDSPLAPLDTETLRAWWRPATLAIVRPAALPTEESASGGRFALEPWLVMAAGLVLLAEMFLVHWLCPRVATRLTPGPARRRGSVAPLRSREATHA